MKSQNRQENKTAIIAGIIIVVLILIAGAWYAYSNPAIAAELGLRPAPSMMASSTMPGMNMGSTTPGRYGDMRGSFVTGSIEVLNDNGFTLTLQNGNTENVILSATTTINDFTSATAKPTTITADQLSVGEQVQVIGATNSDGSISARAIRTGTFPTAGARRTHSTTGSAPAPTAQ
jgi:hypothetical protein